MIRALETAFAALLDIFNGWITRRKHQTWYRC
jgi:hypothetical protein